MNAVVSAQAGIALLIDNNDMFVVRVNDTHKRIPVNPAAVHLLFADCLDLQFLERTTVQAVKMALQMGHLEIKALELVLILIDQTNDDGLRTLAATRLSQVLHHSHVSEFVNNILCARPFPSTVNISSAVRLCDAASATHVATWLTVVSDMQREIGVVASAWDTLDNGLFTEPGGKPAFHCIAVRRGLFVLLMSALRKQALNPTAILDSPECDIFAHLPSYKRVVHAWCRQIELKAREYGVLAGPSIMPSVSGPRSGLEVVTGHGRTVGEEKMCEVIGCDSPANWFVASEQDGEAHEQYLCHPHWRHLLASRKHHVHRWVPLNPHDERPVASEAEHQIATRIPSID